ncbi:hypothetical protein JEZ13_03415 [bacterium]|nr:hypothetical protein [bacterium]
MSFWSKLGSITKTVAQNVYQEIQKEQAKKAGSNLGSSRNDSPGSNRTQSLSWRYIGTLDNVDDGDLRHLVGIYKAVLNGEIVYIGRAVEFNNGGLKKRLADYTRESESSRKHKSGQLMHQNASDLKMYIMVTGSDSQAANEARELEIEMINRYQPAWNVKYS